MVKRTLSLLRALLPQGTGQAAAADLERELVLRKEARGERWTPNGERFQIAGVSVSSVSPQGDVRAACHLVLWPAIERLARHLGYLEGA